MVVELRVEPVTTPMTWRQFCKKSPAYSIALDGFLNEGPKLDHKTPRANFDHHHGVSRLETRATCAQVLMAVRMGLFDLFQESNEPKAIVFANDCDQDVCTAWTILKHSYLAKSTMNPVLNRLVDIEDKLDATGGAYPYPDDLPVLQQLAWVYEPYTQFRLSGGLEQHSSSAFSSIITDVENRIIRYIPGNGSSVTLNTEYKVLGSGNGWIIVDEIGAQAKTGIFSDGIKAFLSVKERKDGRYGYILGRMSEFIPFPLPELLDDFKKAEGKQKDQWGGATTIIGSPRINGSKLKPEDVIEIIKQRVPD